MTGVDKDLATLRDLIEVFRFATTSGRRDAYEALARVEAELSRLREQLVERPTLEEAIANVNYWKDEATRLREQRVENYDIGFAEGESSMRKYHDEEQRLAAAMRQERDEALELLQAAEARVEHLTEACIREADKVLAAEDALQSKHGLLCEAIRRGEAAEARCAELEEDLRDERNDAVQDEAYIKRLKARCARLQQALLDSDDYARGYRDGVREERKRSKARCARLQQALRVIRGLCREGHGDLIAVTADDALAGPGSEQSSLTESGSAGLPDTPADSQPEEPT